MTDSTYNLNGGFKPTTKRFADLNGPDFFPTPAWATHALIDNESFNGEIWESACGNGAMSRVLEHAKRRADNIVTNPPYNAAEGFVRSGVSQAKHKFALLLRLAFLEGANRANTIFSQCPPSRVWVFSERITFYPAGAIQQGSGTTAYAWFVWDKDAPSGTELKWFKPGYKHRFN